VKPPPIAIAVATPATIHSAATTQVAAETVRWCRLLVVCHMFASL
jgi:hypothetical protein